jgi:hypothetical protein
MTYCTHCNQEFDKRQIANHSRWCEENPKRDEYKRNLKKARDARVNFKNQFSYGAVVSDETREKLRVSATGKRHTEEVKDIIRQKALASKHRRLKKNVFIYNNILLDSSWELELAKRLDELQIAWIRPDPIPWIDELGQTHNYFPDFYLVDYDIYLDPKNKHARKVQEKKLKLLLDQYHNIVILPSLECCKSYSVNEYICQ